MIPYPYGTMGLVGGAWRSRAARSASKVGCGAGRTSRDRAADAELHAQSTQKFVGIKPVERFECVLGVEQLRFEADLLRIVQPHDRYLDIVRMRIRHDLPCSG